MDIRDYTLILRKRWRLIVLCTLLAVAASLGATFASTPTYQATAQLFVSTDTGAAGTTSGLQQGGQFAQQRVKSYAEVVNSPSVTEAVVAELGLTLNPRQLADSINASAPLDTVLINVEVTNGSAALAQQIANSVAARFTVVAAELETPAGGTFSPVKVSVVRTADLPAAPVSPRPTLNLALGLLVGLAVGVGAAVLRETLDTTIKGTDEVQTLLDLPTIGMIAYDADAGTKPLIVHDDPQSTRSEAFRQLRTNLQFLDIDHRPRSIVVTSAVPGEGKSTTACNLALALAQSGLRVILVEADLRRPSLAKYLGLENAIGLTDALIGRVPLDDLLQPWGDGRLQVLARGPNPPNPSELLGSQQMSDLLRELEGRADLVLLDSPPLLPVTDSAILARQASGALVVVRNGHTTREQARRAVDSLRSVHAHVYGVVLNMVPTKGPGAYQYGYQYGYRSDSRDAPVPAPARHNPPPVQPALETPTSVPVQPAPAQPVAVPAASVPPVAVPAAPVPSAPAPAAPVASATVYTALDAPAPVQPAPGQPVWGVAPPLHPGVVG